MARRSELVGAVDFGSREVRVLIARQHEDGSIHILGHGTAPGRGCVSQGVIQDVAAAQRALKSALRDAEKEAGVRVAGLFCGLQGKNVETHIREGQVKLEKEVVELAHMEEALDLASRDILAAGKNIVSSITSQEWYVDGLRVTDPVGIRGGILKTRVHFAQVPSVIEDNIVHCVESQGKELEDVVYLPLAASLGCLTPEDLELGICVLDLGRSTSGLAIYRERRILATHSFSWGGFHITRDVAAGLHTSFEEAIELIQEYGISEDLIAQLDDEDDEAATAPNGRKHRPEDNGRQIKLKDTVRGASPIVDRSELEEIIFERSHELLTKVRQYLMARGLAKNLVRGVVLTGGAGGIRNLDKLAEAVFQAPARVGMPDGIETMPGPVEASSFVPAVGILRHGFEYRTALRSGRLEPRRGLVVSMARGIGNFVGKYFF